MVFLSNYLVFKIVLAAVTGGRIDYPVAGDLELKYDTANKIYLSGGSLKYVDDATLYTTIGEETTSYDIDINKAVLMKTGTRVASFTRAAYQPLGGSQDGVWIAVEADQASAGAVQMYKGDMTSGVYTEFGSAAVHTSSTTIAGDTSWDGKYVIMGTNSSSTSVYKIAKNNFSSGLSVLSTTYASLGSKSDGASYRPTFVPGTYDFILTGTDNNSNMYIRLYKHNEGTDTWTAVGSSFQPTTTGRPTRNAYQGFWVKSATSDGLYLLVGSYSTYAGWDIYKLDWTANSAIWINGMTTPSGASSNFGHGGSITPDGKYIIIAGSAGTVSDIHIYKNNTNGDWTSYTDVTAEHTFNSPMANNIHFIDNNKRFIGRVATSPSTFYIDNFREDLLVDNYYITDAGKYSVDATIAGLKYKTNEVDVTSLNIPAKVVQVSGGFNQSMALTQDGSVYAWGEDTYGQMGQGTTDTNVNTPVKVKGVGGSGFLSNITKISCGGRHCIALASDGTLYAWGDNTEGQCGDGSATERKTPVTVSYSGDAISNISAGYMHSGFTTTTGKVYCWGQGTAGQIGDNQSSSDRTSPTQVVDVGGSGTLTGIRDIACGDSVTHAIKDSNGALYGWGKNYYGMVGNGGGNAAGNETSPVAAIFASDNSAVTGITQISGGGDHVMFLKSDGTVYGAGYNGLGQIGNGTITDADDGLVQVQGVGGSSNLTGITQIAVCDSTSLALKSDGTMYSWGNNYNGQNGLGTIGGTNPTTPVAITLLTGVDTIAGEGRPNHFIASKSDGSVFCWGRGTQGQIGDGTNTVNQGTPTQVLAGAGPSVDGKFNLLTEPRLTFDGYNKLSLLHGLSSVSSKLFLGSNVYDIGTLTSDLTIETPGLYRGLVFDTSSNVAYFNKTTVGAIASTMAGYEVEQILYGTHNSDSPSQGGFGHYIDTNGDGTRFVLGLGMDPTTGQYDGRVKVYHLESGTWTLKVDLASPNTASQRFGDSVCMNEDGTRIVVNHYPNIKAYIYDYASGAWPTTPTATIIGGTPSSFGEGDMDMNKAGTVIVFGSRSYGTQIWSRAGDGTWSETKNWGNGFGGYGVAINGAGTRIVTGKESTGEIFEGNYVGGSWGSLTSVIDTSYTDWPAKIRMDSDGTTLIVNADPATEAGIYERQSGTSWTLSQSILSSASYYSRNGLSISYDGNMVLVGDMTNDTDGNNFGRAFLWNKSGGSWSLTKTFSNPKTSPAVNDYWGAGVAIAKNTKDRIMIGMSADSTAGTEYGSVYVHTNAIPDFISFDTYNKLSLSGITNPTSKIHALPTGADSTTTTYDIGSATNIYIESAGTYTAEMKGSSAFALDSNVATGTIGPETTLSERSEVKQFIYDENGYTDAYFSGGGEQAQGIRLSDDGLAMAIGDNRYNSRVGRAYYYERSSISGTFTKTHTFDAVQSGSTYDFGNGIAMNEAKTRIAISAPDSSSGGTSVAKIYVYDRASTSASWPGTPTFTIDYPNSSVIRFARGIEMSGDGNTILAGSDSHATNSNSEGGMFVFEYASSSWSKTFEVTNSTHRFGMRIHMSKDGTRIIGGGTPSGMLVYHKVSGTWSSTIQLTTESAHTCGISPDGNTVAVGILGYSSNLGRVAVYKYSASSWGSVVYVDTTVGSGTYQFGTTPRFNNDGTLLVTGCSAYNSYMGCFEMWKYESGSWVFKKQFLNPTVKTGHGGDNGEFFGEYMAMDNAGTSLIVSNQGNDVQGADYGRVVLYGAVSPPSLTFDTYNKYTFTGADTGSTYKLKYESNTYDLGTISNVYIAHPGTYSAEIKGATNFGLSSNVATIQTVTQPTLVSSISITASSAGWGSYTYEHQSTNTSSTYYEYKISADPTNSVYFIAYNWTTNKWYDTNPGTTHSTFGTSASDTSSTSRETTENPAVVYVMASNALHAQFINPYFLGPSLDFDTYNKLTFSGLESGSTSNVTFDGKTYSIGSATNIYIENAGTYNAESKGTTTFALTKKQVSSSPSDTPADSSTYNLKYTINRHPYLGYTYSRMTELSIVDGLDTHTWSKTGSFFNTDGQEYEYMFIGESSGTSTSTTVALPHSVTTTVVTGTSVASDFTNRIWNGSASTTSANEQQSCTPVSADSPGTSILEGYIEIQGTYTSAITPAYLLLGFTDGYNFSTSVTSGYGGTVKSLEVIVDGMTYFNIDPDQYTRYGIAGTLLKHVTNISANKSLFAIKLPNKIHVPKLKFNDYKLSINGIKPTSSTLKYGSNTYEIGTATNIYVENTGDYSAEIGNATDFALTNTTVSGTLKTVEPTLSGGYFFGHALTYDGKLYGWGENSNGELGVGDNTDKTVPTLCTGITQGEVVSIWNKSKRSQNQWAKTRDGKIWVTGEGTQYNIPGQTSNQTSFIDVTSYFGDQSLTANNITQISGHGVRTVSALTESGNVWTWGTHNSSMWNLGQGTGASSSNTPKQITFGGVTDNITRFEIGNAHGVALDTDGDVWFWGQIWANGAGVDYPQTTLSDVQKSPHEIMTSNNIIGVSSTYFTIYAWQSDGTYYALGQDSAGQIGDGTATAGGHTSWQKVDYFSANNITINEIYGGAYHVFADTSDGYYCWGGGTHGNFGNGSTGNLASPTKWTNVSNIKVFSSGSYECPYAITEDGKYYAWGNGTNYARGDNTTGDITYPKYIDTLPNILAPSFDFDGYDKIHSNKNYFTKDGKITRVNASIEIGGPAGGSNNAFLELTLDKDTDVRMTGAEFGNGVSQWVSFGAGSYATVLIGSDGYIYFDDGVGGLGWGIERKGKWTIGEWIFLTGSGGPGSGNNYTRIRINSQFPDFSGSGDTSIKFNKGVVTYDANQAQIITVSDPGTYDAQLSQDSLFSLKSATVPATSSTGLYTWAFHHGNFDNAYGDGDILTARENGRFYADTPAYTGDIGTITPASAVTPTQPTLVDNIAPGSHQGVAELGGSAVYYRKSTTSTSYIYGFGSSGSGNTIQDIAYDWVEQVWKDVYIDVSTNSIHNSFGASASEASFAYSKASPKNPPVVYIYKSGLPGPTYGTGTLWAQFTNPYYVDTVSSTTYTFEPPSGGLTANVLMVAGGGGGGGRYHAGGGGAGGLVYTAGTSLAQDVTKTIVVGNGDSGGNADGSNATNGFNGKNTTFTGLTTADGGGGGGKNYTAANSGGSGGGGGASQVSGNPNAGGSGTADQGYAGGVGIYASDSDRSGGGGGGAGGVGIPGVSGSVSGEGGIGKFFGTGSSFTNFGDEYGEAGYFAGGGGGGVYHSGRPQGIPGRGGGGYGAIEYGYMGIGGSQHALPHTGGGGGGSGMGETTDQHRDFNSAGDGGVLGHGGRGGSGIVLIQTNVAPPNGANTAVVQVGNPRRRSLPPAVDHMGSEVNRAIIIHGDSMPTYKLPTHWYWDPVGSNSNDTLNSGGGDKFFLVKRPDGITSNVFYIGQATSGELIEYGTKMAQTADAVFMPIESQNYDTFLCLGSNGGNDIHLGMNSSGVAALRRSSGGTDITVGTIKCFTVGKWHHVALTVDSGGNAVGYVNGYPVVTGTYTSMPTVGDRAGHGLMRVGLGGTFRKSLTYECSTYNFHMSPKQVLQRAAEVGLGPKLEYDGLNTIKILNTEPGSSVKLFTSNVADTSNVFIVADPAAGEYTVPEAGKYYAEIKGTDTFTITKTLDVSGTFPLYAYPPRDGTQNVITNTSTANDWNIWTVSGAANGNGQYQARSNRTASGTRDAHAAFSNNITAGDGEFQVTHNSSGVPSAYGTLDLQLPSAKTIRKYVIWTTDSAFYKHNSTTYTDYDPTLPYNGSERSKRRIRTWDIQGSNSGNSWTTIHTVTDKPPSIYGDVHTISSPGSYQYYRLAWIANNTSRESTCIAELIYYGDA